MVMDQNNQSETWLIFSRNLVDILFAPEMRLLPHSLTIWFQFVERTIAVVTMVIQRQAIHARIFLN